MKGLLFAGAVGYLVGTLWAPRKGSLLRAEIMQHFEKIQEEGSEFVQDGLKEGQQMVSDVVEKGQELKTTATKKLAVASSAVSRAGEIAGESFEQLGNGVGEIANKGKDLFSDNQS
jgi:gas vesicle protein